VPAKNAAAHNLLTVQMTQDGGAVQQLVAQGHTVPLERPFSSTSATLLADQLDKTGLCCGLVDKAQLQCAKDHPALQHCVETLDGAGVFGWNEAILARHKTRTQGVAAGGGAVRWRSAVHAASETATETVRAPGCCRVVPIERGGRFQPNCDACYGFLRNSVKDAVKRARDEAAELADPVKAAARAKRRAGPGMNTKYMEQPEREKRAKGVDNKMQRLCRRVRLLEAAAKERMREGEDLDDGMVKDLNTIMDDPAIKKKAHEQFGNWEESDGTEDTENVAELLWADSNKYRKRRAEGKQQGMRWHPTVIRWALLFWTRANPGAYDELNEILSLPSKRTLRGCG
jgi:hypothetical protein